MRRMYSEKQIKKLVADSGEVVLTSRNQEINGQKKFNDTTDIKGFVFRKTSGYPHEILCPGNAQLSIGGLGSVKVSELLVLHQSNPLSATPSINADTGRLEIEFSTGSSVYFQHFLFILTGETFYGITPISEQYHKARGCMSMPVGSTGGSMIARYELSFSGGKFKYTFDDEYSTALANNPHTFGTWYLQRLG